MPSTRNALKKLLDVTERQIAQAEARLMKAASDEERTRLVDTLTDLHVAQAEIADALTEGGQA